MSNLDSLFSFILMGLKEPLCVLDHEMRCVFGNRAFKSFLGIDPASIESDSLSSDEFWPGLKHDMVQESEIVTEFKLRNGEVLAVKLDISPLPQGHSLVKVLVGSSRSDGLQHFHRQRLETLGMLAGGVAHDFNNILTGILGHISYLKTIFPGDGPHSDSLRAVQDGAKKASAITQQILDFSKSDLAEKAGAVNMTELITKTCQLLRGAISPDHKIIIQLPAESLYVLGVDAKLVQVVVNLMTNARDALGDSGTVKVGLERCRDINLLSKVFNLKELPCSEYLRLYVEDTGHGMTGEVMERMFEAYFSTKKKHGTGLGLSTVASIVRALGGTVSVSSKVGTGTSISVFLPELDWSFESAFITKDEAREIEGGNENILIIDDEDPVRNVLAISLEHLGYQVEMAASGVEALDMFGNGGPPADLVILDMLMPVLSGEKVFFELRKRNPAVKVLVISGYSSQEAIDKILKNGGLGFIQKPFTIEELAKKVRECLAAATKSA